jgi:peptide deformylase
MVLHILDMTGQNIYNEQMDENILMIYKYGDDVLKLKAEEVKLIDEDIIKLLDKMTATMYSTNNGIGLAAPQVGKSLQMSVIDLTMGAKAEERIVLINPEIIESDGVETIEEGCLSLPGISAPVKRKTRLLLRYFDLAGKEHQREFQGFMARAIQHEIDHLQGVLIIDKVSSLRRQMVKKEIKRLKRDGKWN